MFLSCFEAGKWTDYPKHCRRKLNRKAKKWRSDQSGLQCLADSRPEVRKKAKDCCAELRGVGGILRAAVVVSVFWGRGGESSSNVSKSF